MTPFLAFLNIGTFELLVVLVVAVILFGGDLPDVARKTARVVGKMRAMANDIGRELHRPDLERRMGVDLQDVRDEIRDVEANIRRNDARSPTASLPTTTDAATKDEAQRTDDAEADADADDGAEDPESPVDSERQPPT